MISFLSRSHIGNLRESLDILAEFIHLKCERAKSKHDGITVLADDEGDVYAPQASTGSTLLTVNRNPAWLVGTYSMLCQPDQRYHYVPCVGEIAADLLMRRSEIWRPN
jgi:hypothetical protein